MSDALGDDKQFSGMQIHNVVLKFYPHASIQGEACMAGMTSCPWRTKERSR